MASNSLPGLLPRRKARQVQEEGQSLLEKARYWKKQNDLRFGLTDRQLGSPNSETVHNAKLDGVVQNKYISEPVGLPRVERERAVPTNCQVSLPPLKPTSKTKPPKSRSKKELPPLKKSLPSLGKQDTQDNFSPRLGPPRRLAPLVSGGQESHQNKMANIKDIYDNVDCEESSPSRSSSSQSQDWETQGSGPTQQLVSHKPASKAEGQESSKDSLRFADGQTDPASSPGSSSPASSVYSVKSQNSDRASEEEIEFLERREQHIKRHLKAESDERLRSFAELLSHRVQEEEKRLIDESDQQLSEVKALIESEREKQEQILRQNNAAKLEDLQEKMEERKREYKKKLNTKFRQEVELMKAELNEELQKEKERLKMAHKKEIEQLRHNYHDQIEKEQSEISQKESEVEKMASELALRSNKLKRQETKLKRKEDELNDKKSRLEVQENLISEYNLMKEEFEKEQKTKQQLYDKIFALQEDEKKSREEITDLECKVRSLEEKCRQMSESEKQRKSGETDPLQSTIKRLEETWTHMDHRVSELEMSARPVSKSDIQIILGPSACGNTTVVIDDHRTPPVSATSFSNYWSNAKTTDYNNYYKSSLHNSGLSDRRAGDSSFGSATEINDRLLKESISNTKKWLKMQERNLTQMSYSKSGSAWY